MSVKSAISALKKLTKVPRSRKETAALINALDRETDAAVALICCGLAEEALVALLLSRMVDLTNDERAELLGGMGPLSSFSARIKAAYAFGLIGSQTRQNLNIAREVRNAFAHPKKLLSFQTKEVASVCQHVTLDSRLSKPGDDEKRRFIMAAISLWGDIGGRSMSVQRPTPALP